MIEMKSRGLVLSIAATSALLLLGLILVLDRGQPPLAPIAPLGVRPQDERPPAESPLSKIRRLTDQDFYSADAIPQLIALQDALASPHLREQTSFEIRAILANPQEKDSVRAILSFVLAAGLPSLSREWLIQLADGPGDELAAAAIQAMLLRPYDPRLEAEAKGDFWVGVFLQGWANGWFGREWNVGLG